jgi:hypothetical protein
MIGELPLQAPPQHRPKAVATALDNLTRLTTKAAEAHALVYELEQRLVSLGDEQRQAAAAAYVAGKEPARDDQAAKAITDEIEAAKADAAALDDAVTIARQHAAAAILEHAEKWQRDAEREVVGTRAQLLEAVTVLEVAARRFAEAEATAAWIRGLPRMREFGAGAGPVLRSTARLSANRSPIAFPTFLDAVRDAVRPPAPPPPPKPSAPSQLRGVEVAGPRGATQLAPDAA